MFDICVLGMSNIHLAYEFNEGGEVIIVFYQGTEVAKYTLGGMLIQNTGFSDSQLQKFVEIVNLNGKTIENYIDNGEDIIYS